jgi:putative transposase
LSWTGSKKNLGLAVFNRKNLVEPNHPTIPISRQCELLGLARASFYYEPQPETPQNLLLMKMMDEQFLSTPFYGVRRMTAWLATQGHSVNPKRVRRLMRKMGLEAIYPKPNLSFPGDNVRKYPYLLKEEVIIAPNQVWSTDITYIPVRNGYVYLVAVIDWYSRYVLSWELSNSMDVTFCLSALEKALAQNQPKIFNTDQGSQFTSRAFISSLEKRDISISQDGKGRALDNIFIERLWRSVKYEEVYPKNYTTVEEALKGLESYFYFYNNERLHQSLDYQTPAQIHFKQP